MAKTENTENATATTETESKLTPKKLLSAVVLKFSETNVDLTALLGVDLAKSVAEFYDKIKTSEVRGLSLEERLANVETLLTEHYTNMPAIGSAKHAEWALNGMKLMQRKLRIERSIKEGGDHPEPKTKTAKK